jgi:hypothetical protein
VPRANSDALGPSGFESFRCHLPNTPPAGGVFRGDSLTYMQK